MLDDPSQSTDQIQPQIEGITDPTPTLHLPIEDKDLIEALAAKEAAARKYHNDINLTSRQQLNRDFWKGNHYAKGQAFETWQSDFRDPIIYEDLEERITLASARMPDISVTPPNDNSEAMEKASTYEKILELKINNAFTQRLIKRGLRTHHLNFFAVAKGRWDPNLANGAGDFVFELVKTERVRFDHTATIPDNGYTADNMDFIIEDIEEPINLVLAKFPNKRGELLKLLAADKSLNKAGSKMMYKECWFTWYDRSGDIFEGVCWKYQNLILDKKRNPYYDWEGYEVVQAKTDKDGDYLAGDPTKETRYYNYMERPRKPYIFFTYQNLDEGPIDDTTPVEQAIPINRMINRSGRQITEISDNAVPKKVFAGKFIEKAEARRVTSDPDEAIWLDGADDVGKAFMTVTAEPPSPTLIANLERSRQRVHELFAVRGMTNAEEANTASGTSKQIGRESDLGASDDLVDIVVERVVHEMACWATQFMKMFYDEPHYIRQLGRDGSLMYKEFTRTDIQDGLMINVKASSIDAMTRRSDALNLASRKAIDPFTMMQDMDQPNPKERVRRLIAFLNGANDGFASYMAELGIEFEYQQQQQPPGMPGGDNAGNAQAQTDLQNMLAGQLIAPPDKFDESYVQVFVQFIQSGQFDSLAPEIKRAFTDYVDALEQNFQNFAVSTQNAIAPPMGQPPAQPVQPAM